MDSMDAQIVETTSSNGNCWENDNVGPKKDQGNAAEVENFKQYVDDMATKVDELEQKVNEVARFYSSLSKKQPNGSKSSSILKDKDQEKQILGIKKQHQDPTKREAATTKRMQELMRQFGAIFRKITTHDWSWPFRNPVDVEGLGLHDYYEIIEKPMDFGTIKKKMEAKDDTGYKNVRDMCADVRLVLKNAMTYNEERADVHIMAKTLLEKFEEKWLQLLPKVIEEETRHKEEKAEMQRDMQLVQVAANAKMAKDLSNELYEIDTQLDELREMVVQNCSKISLEEKQKLGADITLLPPEDLRKVLEIYAQKNPGFQLNVEEADVDIDSQSDSTLWRLKIIVKEALEGKIATTKVSNDNAKRKREICDALAKTAKKRSKKLNH